MTSTLSAYDLTKPASYIWHQNCSLLIWPNWLLTDDLNIVHLWYDQTGFWQMTSTMFIYSLTPPASGRWPQHCSLIPNRLLTDDIKIVHLWSDLTSLWQILTSTLFAYDLTKPAFDMMTSTLFTNGLNKQASYRFDIKIVCFWSDL